MEPGLVLATITGPGDQEMVGSPYWLYLGQLEKLKKQHCLFVNEHMRHELKKRFKHASNLSIFHMDVKLPLLNLSVLFRIVNMNLPFLPFFGDSFFFS